MAAWHIPGSLRSSTKVPWPVTSRGSSRRLMPDPNRVAMGASSNRPGRDGGWGGGGGTRGDGAGGAGALLHDGGLPYRCDDVLVAGAAAEVPLKGMADLLLRGVGVGGQQVRRGHDHPGRAEAALEPVLLPERLLQRMEPSGRGQAFDGGDGVAFGLDGEHGAALHRP